MNLPQPPEGVLHPRMPWSRINPNSRLWLILKSKLTGRRQGNEHYRSYVNLSDEDADRLIANIKKDPRGYPSLDQESGNPVQWMERQRIYQEWLVEAYLNDPFVEEKVIEQTSEVLVEAQEEIQEAETTEEVSEILEDKIEILEDIQEKISPPPTENKIPDPWEGSYTTPKTEKKKKRARKRLKRPRPSGVIPNRRKKKTNSSSTPKPKRKSRSRRSKKTFATKMGGSVRKTTGGFGNAVLDLMEKAPAPLGENQGPSVLAIGAAFGKKIQKAFDEAREQRERAIKAEENGAELPPEVKEKGYFIRKSLGYQFGGRAFDTTLGAFLENMPSKQSKQRAGFKDQFDYGDADPDKQRKQSEIKDLAKGFRLVNNSLRAINTSIGKQIKTLSDLVAETSRVADATEAVAAALAKTIDIEIETADDEQQAQEAVGFGDINIGDINLDTGGGLNWLDYLFAADDIRDITKSLRGGEKSTTKKPKITGDVPRKNRFKIPSFGRRMKFAEGGAVPALVGEAGPEIVQRAGTMPQISGIGNTKIDQRKIQSFVNVMETPFQVIGARISSVLSNLVSVAGPFSGVIAKMFKPLLGGLATIFGLNQGAFAAELNSAAMTEKQGAKELAKFFSNFFSIFGFKVDGKKDKKDNDTKQTTATGDWGALLDLIASGEGNYDSVNPSLKRPEILDMTIADLKQWQISSKAKDGGTAAAGRYQIMYPESYANVAGMSLSEKFTPANQDKLAAAYIENRRRGKEWKEGKISDEEFGYELAAEWAALKQPNGRGRYDGDGRNSAKIDWSKTKEVLQKIKGGPATKASKGVVKASSLLGGVQGVFRMDGPDTGYRVPNELTGDKEVIGHGEELLFKFPNKFMILPVVNKEYNAYQDPDTAFNRYREIGRQGGVEVAGLVDAMDRFIFGSGKKGPSSVQYGGGAPSPKKYRGWAADEDGAEILKTLGGIPVKGASLPQGSVTPIAIPKDTVTGTSGGAVVAMMQPVVQYVPIPVPGPERIEYVPTNQYVAASKLSELQSYWSVS